MSKLPTKQIYLLLIIIVGIVALSVYSTYAIFTLEGETSSVVTIHTPNTLKITENMSEYRQITIPKNSYINTDVDIYNTFTYDLCYSTWYKIPNKSIETSSIKVFQVTATTNTSSGIIPSITGVRVPLLIINDNDYDVKINIGVSTNQKKETCSLNIDNDKTTITKTINSYQELSTYLKENNNKFNEDKEGYLTYKNLTKEIILPNEVPFYISDKFTYQGETFTLTNPKEITTASIEDITQYKDQYLCIEGKECSSIYQIITLKKETANNNDIYKITNYNLLNGYLAGKSGIKKVTTNNIDNYLYYGDNPHNFIYYNCTNEQDTSTCELWRIIGTYYDQTEKKYLTKIIKNNYLEPMKYQTNQNNSWNNSLIKKYLDTEYKLNNQNYLKEITYQEEYIDESQQIKYLNTELKSKINLLNITDYLSASVCSNLTLSNLTSTCLQKNYLNLLQEEWTRTIDYKTPTTKEQEESPTVEIINDKVYTIGSSINLTNINNTLKIRPVVYLKSRVLLTSGDGTIDSPYIIK